jgi:hypothetical protein
MRKIDNLAENNRAEQEKTANRGLEHDPPPTAAFEIGYISLCRERRVLSRQKTRRGHPPGNLHNSD